MGDRPTKLSPPFGAYARWRHAGDESDADALDLWGRQLAAAQRVLDAADAVEQLPGWAECEDFCLSRDPGTTRSRPSTKGDSMITALHNLGMRHRTDKATYHHYCDFYEEHLPRDVTRLLEIGVMDGASLRMWRDYYPGAAIVGIDILPRKPVRGCVVMQGDATRGMDAVRAEVYGPFDVIVDDGSHMTLDQQVSLGLLWGGVNPGGCYVVEDLHTSFMPNYVNSAYNTVEVLRSVEPGDPEWPGIAAIEWYSRTGKYDGDDSITAIIKKAP